MSNINEYKNWFQEVLDMNNEFEQAQAFDELSGAAEEFYLNGDHDKARYLFEQLLTLGSVNDLYQVAYDTSVKYLKLLGVIKVKGLDEIIEEAKKEFANLPEGPLNLAIAKKDQREKSLCLLSLMK